MPQQLDQVAAVDCLTSEFVCMWLLVLGVVVLAGGVGGFCAGFSHRDKHTLVFPWTGRERSMGFLGDVFIGQASALAGLLLLSLGEYKLEEVVIDLTKLMKVMSLCVVAGFTGLRLMHNLSHGLLRKVEQQEERVESVEQKVDVSKKVNALLIEAAYMRVKEKHLEESQFCREALALDPDNEEALIGLAVSRSMIDEPINFGEAVTLLRRVVDGVNPESARAYYNLCCIGNLMEVKYPERFPGDPLRAQVLENLSKAIRHSPAYRTYALDDPDLANLRSDAAFKRIVQ